MLDIVQITLSILTVFLCGWAYYKFKHQLTKYHEAKGTNQATKEDIGEITKIVETIKTDLLHGTEELKAKLTFTNQNKLALLTAEREVIIEYNKRIAEWVHYLTGFNLFGYDVEDYKNLKEEVTHFQNLQREYKITTERLIILFDESDFLDSDAALYKAVAEYQTILTKTIYNIYTLYDNHGFYLSNPFEEQAEAHRNAFYNSYKKLVESCRNECSEIHKTINLHHTKLSRLLKARLSKISNTQI